MVRRASDWLSESSIDSFNKLNDKDIGKRRIKEKV